MTFPLTLCFAILTTSLISSVNAQIVYRRRRVSLGRIIAGAVIGSVCGIVLLCFLCIMMKRRRSARNAVNPGVGGSSTMMSKPMFGGPWGRQQQQPMHHQNQNQSPYTQAPVGQHQGNPYWNTNGQQVQQGYDENGAPPQYTPPSVAGPANNTQSYAPPPGPPPQAHMKGDSHDGNNFVGGFQPPK